MTYREILLKVYAGDLSTIPDRLLCLDPGETTGWALFEKGVLTRYGQCETVGLSTEAKASKGDKVIKWNALHQLFVETDPTHVVCENYRIYAHKLDRHSFSQVETLRLIGGIDMLCIMGWYKEGEDVYSDNHHDYVTIYERHEPIPINYAMAVQAKGFVTDERLKEWDLWKPGMRHSRDAIRHGLYFLIITNKPKGGK